MKGSLKSFLSVAAIVSSLVLFFVMRTLPVSKIWKNYSVLYVENSVPEQNVIGELESSGVQGTITLSQQNTFLSNPLAPYMKMQESCYRDGRELYFQDQERNFRVFYIPNKFQKKASRSAERIARTFNVRCGMDGKGTYPFLVPLMVLFVGAILALGQEKRLHFALCLLFQVCFALSFPFWPAACVSILNLLALTIALRFWKRRNFLSSIFSNPPFMIISIASLVLAFILSPKSGLLYIFAVLSQVGLLVLIDQAEKSAEKKKAFTFEFIVSSRQMAKLSSKNLKSILTGFLGISVSIAVFLFSARFGITSSVMELNLPSPVSSLSEDQQKLPGIDDYYDWYWNVTTYPYRSISRSYSAQDYSRGAVLTMERFQNTDNGISVVEQELFRYDDDFISEINSEIQRSAGASLEKFLLKEMPKGSVAYSNKSRGRGENTVLNLVLMLISLCIPLLVYIKYNIRRKNYEFNK